MREFMKETCRRFLADVSSREKWEAQPHSSLETTDWRDLAELGVPRVALPEELGGVGGDFGDMCELAFESGYAASYLPLIEVAVGYWLCGVAGVALPDRAIPILVLSAADSNAAPKIGSDQPATIAVEGVPSARFATHLLLPASDADGGSLLTVIPTANSATISPGSNAADEPRDRICVTSNASMTTYSLPFGRDRILHVSALLHANQIAGAMNKALEMTIAYTQERSQFGRQLAKFQAVQHMIAQAAAQVAAATTISRAAAEAWDAPSFTFLSECAKGRASEAVRAVTDVVHQCYGAMGFTRECLLHVFTRRLWCWREEYGNEHVWYARIGRDMRDRDGDIWANITELG
ncbi:acyl-CoA dehydrogenase/hypothetical protein [Rhodopseudomonas pseudopalustris]|uniref:Acyl-CoA dehydrogenase n=2 Tax=Rhodopseudomonas pseudopalustris TaxID=1513892 RepID=A0A1H8M8M1_9BRAD|nr:acyl-CoA dehydrogenase/hypothetical protein [Rhodopseudomonas pseudopalustris]